jgi:hypothetical protein
MKPAADPHNSILINSVGNLYSDLSLADFIAISENSSRSAASLSQKAQSEAVASATWQPTISSGKCGRV